MDHSFHFSNTRVIRSLWKSDSLFLRANRSFFSLNHISWGWKQILCSFKFIALLALLKRRCVWIALVTLLKRLIHSFKKWKRAIHSFLSKYEQFARKTKELIPNPVLSCASWGKLWCFPFLKGGEMKVWVVSCLTPLMAVLCRFPWIQIREYCIFPPFYIKIPPCTICMWIMSTTPSLSKDFLISPSSCEDLQHWTTNLFSIFKILSCRKVKGET